MSLSKHDLIFRDTEQLQLPQKKEAEKEKKSMVVEKGVRFVLHNYYSMVNKALLCDFVSLQSIWPLLTCAKYKVNAATKKKMN